MVKLILFVVASCLAGAYSAPMALTNDNIISNEKREGDPGIASVVESLFGDMASGGSFRAGSNGDGGPRGYALGAIGQSLVGDMSLSDASPGGSNGDGRPKGYELGAITQSLFGGMSGRG
ncbi:uncharacterized protein BX664DRAFT_342160 [Halteromyces radiatus]|uniref:uncharacterized protein n=1 Tax=Halteromyces radiatus TaxID=101107 RepID=UPI00221FCEB9|nr:uncharacterized protein BX664DRAFT_342160 [Halteromyces radiatus]KAI8080041.1 hypothetical protein BX664DRAFT_342160 [Halteromyces radiatus]